jgi:AraC-like DNA-binding protein
MIETPDFLSGRPPPVDDVLSEVLSSLRLRGALYCSSELSAPWGITFEARACAAFHVVDRGSCWMRLPGQEPLALRGGDLVLLPHGDEHTLSDTPRGRGRVVDFKDHPGVCGPQVCWGGGGVKTSLVCGEIHVEEEESRPVRSQLPGVMLIRGGEGRASEWMQPTLKFLASEAGSARTGSYAVITRLVELLFMQALRDWVEGGAPLARGWLAGLRDPSVARALALIHRTPGHAWTVESLARGAGLSRSAFAERFTSAVGEAPLGYLTRWRMQRAAAWLRTERTASMSEIAGRVGYDSEAAFSRAFKRVVGVPPRHVRKAPPLAAPGS